MAKDRYEVAGRVRKVTALLGAARVLHITAAQVATDPQARAQLVGLAKVLDPSDETWRRLVEAMIRDEATLASYARRCRRPPADPPPCAPQRPVRRVVLPWDRPRPGRVAGVTVTEIYRPPGSVALVGTDCGYCGSDRDTTVIPEAWAGARKLIVCRRCGEVTELGCWPQI